MKLIFFLFLISCSFTNKELVRGVPEKSYALAQRKIIGKGPLAIEKILGAPAIQGFCKTCSKNGLHRMIYPVKDMRRFYLEISYNTDVDLECSVIDLYPVKRAKEKFVFYKSSKVRKYSRCNQADGPIIKLQEALELQN